VGSPRSSLRGARGATRQPRKVHLCDAAMLTTHFLGRRAFGLPVSLTRAAPLLLAASDPFIFFNNHCVGRLLVDPGGAPSAFPSRSREPRPCSSLLPRPEIRRVFCAFRGVAFQRFTTNRNARLLIARHHRVNCKTTVRKRFDHHPILYFCDLPHRR
jgi:hypothetical protein